MYLLSSLSRHPSLVGSCLLKFSMDLSAAANVCVRTLIRLHCDVLQWTFLYYLPALLILINHFRLLKLIILYTSTILRNFDFINFI